MEEFLEKYKDNYDYIKDCLVVAKELEICAEYPELKTFHFEKLQTLLSIAIVKKWERGRPSGILPDPLRQI